MKRIVVAALVAFLAVPLAHAQIARVFLSGTGSDASDCTNAATPCRSLQGAIDQAPPGAEVIVMASGGYGGATITKSISVNAASGVVAFVARTITINAPGSTVVLRGLTMNGINFPDAMGIDYQVGFSLMIENCVIAGFPDGIRRSDNDGRLFLSNTDFRNLSGTGILIDDSLGVGAFVTIERCRFVRVATAISAANHVYAAVRDSSFLDCSTALHMATTAALGHGIADMHVERCVFLRGETVFSTIATNDGTARIRVSNSTIVSNVTLAQTINNGGDGASGVYTYGNNRVSATASGAFTGPVARS